ncbi:right-handed parallel beta-helix repeat-containing protein [Dinoroseobacter sp. S76]|uniref:right-handed parallel beta-helix repeat-containing protein n=1 Tax=Dinoroseobacter sp. S76 TaxID=3415124 RepID=UPI003C7D7871
MHTALYTARDGFDSETIVVASDEALTQALTKLSEGNGGTILLDGNAGPYMISATKVGSAESPILIKPLDEDTPPEVLQVFVQQASHITITGMDINSGEYGETRPSWLSDVNVSSSDMIEIVGNTMESDAGGFLTKTNGVEIGENAVSLRDSTNITFSHNTMTDYNNGIVYREVKGLDISHNDISGIQSDGMRGGGIQDVVISHNNMHDFHGSSQDVNHTDMIQIWGTNAKLLTSNVVISHNLLDAGNGAASQGIFIRNEEFSTQGYYQDIEIHDNVIYSGMPQGIGLSDTQGAEIYNNTLLWNTGATTQSNTNSPEISSAPKIIVTNLPEAQISKNVTGSISINDKAYKGNNYLVNYTDPASETFVGNHVLNLSGLGDGTLADLQFLPNSPLYGTYGAAMSTETLVSSDDESVLIYQYDLVGNRLGVGVSAEYSVVGGQRVDPDTTEITWIFSDNTVRMGLVAEHTFNDPGIHSVTLRLKTADGQIHESTRLVEVLSTENLSLVFGPGGVSDSSHWESDLVVSGAVNNGIVGTENGYGFRLDGSSRLAVTRENDQIFNLDTFQIDLGFTMDGGSAAGTLLALSGAFSITVNADGSLSAVVVTDEGTFKMATARGQIEAGVSHDISLNFDGLAETMSLSVDGTVLAQTTATGTTPPLGHHSMTLGGASWSKSAKGVVDSFEMTVPPSIVYDDTLPGENPAGPTDEVQEPDVVPISEEIDESEGQEQTDADLIPILMLQSGAWDIDTLWAWLTENNLVTSDDNQSLLIGEDQTAATESTLLSEPADMAL